MITFRVWISQFVENNDAIGDLARDISRDFEFPKSNKRDVILNHLSKLGACPNAVTTFDLAYSNYLEKCKK